MNGDQQVKQVFWGSVFILLFISATVEAAHHIPQKISCQTPYGEKAIQITEAAVHFIKEQASQDRNIASDAVKNIRTRLTHKGFEKVLYHQGLKHEIHIEDFSSYRDTHDYLTVTSTKGHKMTYPLNCQ